jgi:hypothetical protein
VSTALLSYLCSSLRAAVRSAGILTSSSDRLGNGYLGQPSCDCARLRKYQVGCSVGERRLRDPFK